jgi:hypothetical protein
MEKNKPAKESPFEVRASLEIAGLQASSEGELIRRARARLGLEADHENILWVEALMVHLDRPIPAKIILPEGHPLEGRDLTTFIPSLEALEALHTMRLQPIDMRWNLTGHERVKHGTSNGIVGVVAETEVRGDQLWVAFAFWMRDFEQEARTFFQNAESAGMSVDMGCMNPHLHEQIPDCLVFGSPRFYGGTILYKELAADKETFINAIAEEIEPGDKETRTMELDVKTILDSVREADSAKADALTSVIATKDELIARLHSEIEGLKNDKSASIETLRGEVEAALKAEYEAHKQAEIAKAVEAAVAAEAQKAQEIQANFEEAQKLAEELKAQVAEAQQAALEAKAELERQVQETRDAQVLAERLGALSEILEFAEGEVTEALKAELTAASEEKFINIKLQREIAALKAGKQQVEAPRELSISAHAAYKGTSTSAGDASIEELAGKLATALG